MNTRWVGPGIGIQGLHRAMFMYTEFFDPTYESKVRNDVRTNTPGMLRCEKVNLRGPPKPSTQDYE